MKCILAYPLSRSLAKRLIALLLVPCLIAEPGADALATHFPNSHVYPTTVQSQIDRPPFEEQALTLTLVSALWHGRALAQTKLAVHIQHAAGLLHNTGISHQGYAALSHLWPYVVAITGVVAAISVWSPAKLPAVEVIHPERLEGGPPEMVGWDFDKTVWDGYPTRFQERLWAELIHPVNPELARKIKAILKRARGLSPEERYRELLAQGEELPDQDTFMVEVRRRLGHEINRKKLLHPSYLMPGVADLLAAIQQAEVRQEVFTGGKAGHREFAAISLGVKHYFDDFHGEGRKAEALFEAAQRKGSGQPPYRVIALIGDGPADMQAAGRAEELAREAGRSLRVIKIAFARTSRDRQMLYKEDPDIIINRNFLAKRQILNTLGLKTVPAAAPGDPTKNSKGSTLVMVASLLAGIAGAALVVGALVMNVTLAEACLPVRQAGAQLLQHHWIRHTAVERLLCGVPAFTGMTIGLWGLSPTLLGFTGALAIAQEGKRKKRKPSSGFDPTELSMTWSRDPAGSSSGRLVPMVRQFSIRQGGEILGQWDFHYDPTGQILKLEIWWAQKAVAIHEALPLGGPRFLHVDYEPGQAPRLWVETPGDIPWLFSGYDLLETFGTGKATERSYVTISHFVAPNGRTTPALEAFDHDEMVPFVKLLGLPGQATTLFLYDHHPDDYKIYHEVYLSNWARYLKKSKKLISSIVWNKPSESNFERHDDGVINDVSTDLESVQVPGNNLVGSIDHDGLLSQDRPDEPIKQIRERASQLSGLATRLGPKRFKAINFTRSTWSKPSRLEYTPRSQSTFILNALVSEHQGPFGTAVLRKIYGMQLHPDPRRARPMMFGVQEPWWPAGDANSTLETEQKPPSPAAGSTSLTAGPPASPEQRRRAAAPVHDTKEKGFIGIAQVLFLVGIAGAALGALHPHVLPYVMSFAHHMGTLWRQSPQDLWGLSPTSNAFWLASLFLAVPLIARGRRKDPPAVLTKLGPKPPGASAADPEIVKLPVFRRIIRERWEVARFHSGLPRAVTVLGSARIPPEHTVYQLAQALGRALFGAGFVPRTGAGPGIMEAVLKGYVETRGAAGIARTLENATQGVHIFLLFKQQTNPFVEVVQACSHFVTRKLALHGNTYGTIALPGGYGTLDEMFEVWQRGRPLILLQPPQGLYKDFWSSLISTIEQSWRETGMEADRIPQRPFITTSPDEAIRYLKGASPKKWKKKAITIEQASRELAKGFGKLEQGGKAITFVGRPPRNSGEWRLGGELSRELLARGRSVRIASRGPLLNAVLRTTTTARALKRLEAVLYIPPGEHLRMKESKFYAAKVVAHDASVHQVLVSKRADAFVFFPGGVGTLNRLFDIVQLMQTDKIDWKPIVLLGTSFWKRILQAIFDVMLLQVLVFDAAAGTQKIDPVTGQPVFFSLISPGDERFFQLADTAEQAREILNQKYPPGPQRKSAPTPAAPTNGLPQRRAQGVLLMSRRRFLKYLGQFSAALSIDPSALLKGATPKPGDVLAVPADVFSGLLLKFLTPVRLGFLRSFSRQLAVLEHEVVWEDWSLSDQEFGALLDHHVFDLADRLWEYGRVDSQFALVPNAQELQALTDRLFPVSAQSEQIVAEALAHQARTGNTLQAEPVWKALMTIQEASRDTSRFEYIFSRFREGSERHRVLGGLCDEGISFLAKDPWFLDRKRQQLAGRLEELKRQGATNDSLEGPKQEYRDIQQRLTERTATASDVSVSYVQTEERKASRQETALWAQRDRARFRRAKRLDRKQWEERGPQGRPRTRPEIPWSLRGYHSIGRLDQEIAASAESIDSLENSMEGLRDRYQKIRRPREPFELPERRYAQARMGKGTASSTGPGTPTAGVIRERLPAQLLQESFTSLCAIWGVETDFWRVRLINYTNTIRFILRDEVAPDESSFLNGILEAIWSAFADRILSAGSKPEVLLKIPPEAIRKRLHEDLTMRRAKMKAGQEFIKAHEHGALHTPYLTDVLRGADALLDPTTPPSEVARLREAPPDPGKLWRRLTDHDRKELAGLMEEMIAAAIAGMIEAIHRIGPSWEGRVSTIVRAGHLKAIELHKKKIQQALKSGGFVPMARGRGKKPTDRTVDSIARTKIIWVVPAQPGAKIYRSLALRNEMDVQGLMAPFDAPLLITVSENTAEQCSLSVSVQGGHEFHHFRLTASEADKARGDVSLAPYGKFSKDHLANRLIELGHEPAQANQLAEQNASAWYEERLYPWLANRGFDRLVVSEVSVQGRAYFIRHGFVEEGSRMIKDLNPQAGLREPILHTADDLKPLEKGLEELARKVAASYEAEPVKARQVLHFNSALWRYSELMAKETPVKHYQTTRGSMTEWTSFEFRRLAPALSANAARVMQEKTITIEHFLSFLDFIGRINAAIREAHIADPQFLNPVMQLALRYLSWRFGDGVYGSGPDDSTISCLGIGVLGRLIRKNPLSVAATAVLTTTLAALNTQPSTILISVLVLAVVSAIFRSLIEHPENPASAHARALLHAA